LIDASGASTLDGKELVLKIHDIDGHGNNNIKIDLKNAGSTFNINDGNGDYNIYDANGSIVPAKEMTYQQLNDVVGMIVSGKLPVSIADKDDYNTAVKNSRDLVDVSLDYKGRLQIKDKTNPSSKIEFSMYDSKNNQFGNISNTDTEGNSLSFMSNNAIAIDEPNIDFFKDIDKMINSVRSGDFNIDSNSANPRNPGIENSILRIDHIMDHVTKMHAKIGSYSNALQSAGERSDFLSLNVKTIRSQVVDVDIAEAYMNFTQISNSYQATLSTISKINSMSLLNYM